MPKMNTTVVRTISLTAVALMVSLSATANADHVNWSSDVEQSLRVANESGQMVLMKFTADWCGYCKKMERETFTKPAVAGLVNRQFVPVLVDADKHKSLVQHLKIKSLPAVLVVSPQMVILKRINGYQTEQKLLPELQQVVAQYQPAPKPNSSMIASAPPAQSPVTQPVSQPRTVSQPTAMPGNSEIFQPSEPVAQPAMNSQPAFGGLCLPSVHETRSLVSGTPQFALQFHGKTLFFTDAQQLQKFKNNPETYWPMYDGNCPVTMAENRKAVEGKLEYAAMFRGKLWLSSSPQHMQKFVKRPTTYANSLAGQQ